MTTDSKFRDLQYIWQKRIQFSGRETTHLDFEARVHHSASFHSSPDNKDTAKILNLRLHASTTVSYVNVTPTHSAFTQTLAALYFMIVCSVNIHGNLGEVTENNGLLSELHPLLLISAGVFIPSGKGIVLVESGSSIK